MNFKNFFKKKKEPNPLAMVNVRSSHSGKNHIVVYKAHQAVHAGNEAVALCGTSDWLLRGNVEHFIIPFEKTLDFESFCTACLEARNIIKNRP